MQSVPVTFATLAVLLLALCFVDSCDFFMMFAICVPSFGWLRLMLMLILTTSDRARTTRATIRQLRTREPGSTQILL